MLTLVLALHNNVGSLLFCEAFTSRQRTSKLPVLPWSTTVGKTSSVASPTTTSLNMAADEPDHQQKEKNESSELLEPQVLATGYSQNIDLNTAIQEATEMALQALLSMLQKETEESTVPNR